MKNFCIFAEALDYIETHLREPLTQEAVAAACHVSLSTLQKLWKYAAHTGMHRYITKRRLTHAARELLEGGKTVTEIALRYQYQSPEVFCRAFSALWGVTPSKFTQQWHSTGIFPRYIATEQNFGGNHMSRQVDLSELYDALQAHSNTYILCMDIVGLMPINEQLGHLAGDAVILEAFRRIDHTATADMLAFRIGGDEFCLVTGLEDAEAVRTLAEPLLAQNGASIEWEGHLIPVSMRIAALRYGEQRVQYHALFGLLQQVMEQQAADPCKSQSLWFF